MDERTTVRLLLLDPDGRILLMQVEDPSVEPGPPVFWATLGGRVEDGEDVFVAARREAREETGQDIILGPPVWYGEQVLRVHDAPTLFKETFVVAFSTRRNSRPRTGRTPSAPSFENWTGGRRTPCGRRPRRSIRRSSRTCCRVSSPATIHGRHAA